MGVSMAAAGARGAGAGAGGAGGTGGVGGGAVGLGAGEDGELEVLLVAAAFGAGDALGAGADQVLVGGGAILAKVFVDGHGFRSVLLLVSLAKAVVEEEMAPSGTNGLWVGRKRGRSPSCVRVNKQRPYEKAPFRVCETGLWRRMRL